MTTPVKLLSPLTKTRLHEDILEQLKDRILRGELVAGTKLPPERELAEQLQVNRTTVREALHKLESIGLVEIKHGNGVFVRDWLESGSLELARHVLFLDGKPNLEVLRNLLTLRRILVPEISFHAAQNRGDKDLKELHRVIHESPEMDPDEKDWRVHNLIARASGNVLFVVFLNAFTSIAQEASRAYFSSPENRERSRKFYDDIYEAIKAKKADKAQKIMAEVLDYAEEQTLAALGLPPRKARK